MSVRIDDSAGINANCGDLGKNFRVSRYEMLDKFIELLAKRPSIVQRTRMMFDGLVLDTPFGRASSRPLKVLIDPNSEEQFWLRHSSVFRLY
jgi:hypothetical protein